MLSPLSIYVISICTALKAGNFEFLRLERNFNLGIFVCGGITSRQWALVRMSFCEFVTSGTNKRAEFISVLLRTREAGYRFCTLCKSVIISVWSLWVWPSYLCIRNEVTEYRKASKDFLLPQSRWRKYRHCPPAGLPDIRIWSLLRKLARRTFSCDEHQD